MYGVHVHGIMIGARWLVVCSIPRIEILCVGGHDRVGGRNKTGGLGETRRRDETRRCDETG